MGGSGRCRVGKGRQTQKAEKERAEQQTGESKKVKRRSLGINIDFLRFFLPRAPFMFEYSRSRGFLRASGNSKLKILMFVFLPEGFWFTFGKGGGAG